MSHTNKPIPAIEPSAPRLSPAGLVRRLYGIVGPDDAGGRAILDELEAACRGLEAWARQQTTRLENTNERLSRELAASQRALEAASLVASTDELTGLVNRREMLRTLGRELARFRRSGRPFSLLAVDLDLFKRVNDRHGHEVGDAVLVRVARFLQRKLRAQDAVARWGGDEFVVFLPDTRLDGGSRVAEKLRDLFARELGSLLGGEPSLSLSAGVSEVVNGDLIGDCLQRADRALYRAKQKGRNRSEAADRLGPWPAVAPAGSPEEPG